jgi:hypothetical protein
VLDGTKIKANASKHKAMSYQRMAKRAAELDAEVERWMSAATAADAAEDQAFGDDESGEEMPAWVADKKRRAQRSGRRRRNWRPSRSSATRSIDNSLSGTYLHW